MEALLDDNISSEDLRKFEQKYNEKLREGQVPPQVKFEYAWSLIRSRYSADIERGLLLLEDLFQNADAQSKRDYVFYIGVGYAKIKNYNKALYYVKKFLSVEPNNRQAQELHKYIQACMKKEGLMGIAMVGGAVLALGGLVGLGIALAKK